jgi:glycosyltransferase involved in cell wall biosynthesis
MVSIVIPIYNHSEQLRSCLKAIHAQQVDFEYECIIVDNGSKEDIASVVSDFENCRILSYTAFKSPYPCRNVGIKAARFPLLVLLDSKCIPQPNWLKLGIRKLHEGTYDLVVGPIEYITTDIKDAYQIASTIMFQKVEESVAKGGFPLGCVFAKRESFEKFGFFPENIRSNGDTVWSNNATRNGAKVGYEPSAIVHYMAKSKVQLLKQALRIGYGNRQLYFKRGDALWLVTMRALWNMRPMKWQVVKQKCFDHGWNFSTDMLFKVWLAMFHYNIFRGMGRLGIKKLFNVITD